MFSTRAGGTGPAGGSAADIDPRLLEYLHCESIAPSGLQLAASLPGRVHALGGVVFDMMINPRSNTCVRSYTL